MGQRKAVQVSTYLEPEDWRRLMAQAQDEGRSLSQMAARLILLGLEGMSPKQMSLETPPRMQPLLGEAQAEIVTRFERAGVLPEGTSVPVEPRLEPIDE